MSPLRVEARMRAPLSNTCMELMRAARRSAAYGATIAESAGCGVDGVGLGAAHAANTSAANVAAPLAIDDLCKASMSDLLRHLETGEGRRERADPAPGSRRHWPARPAVRACLTWFITWARL